ncbi:metabolite traffic protein EboE [Arenibacter sp. GZD96]|uniref:metabolite traffic protein EboE n=1 Tax=Aurantibrevibacter litoralis TaxID=3106030 RepID=UPI002AFFD41E|nr:metabolite traffic protein EboE [Arenibacter sp. GZD-96]MEA1785997.1 metabolite traffic protein EboE [Arenibacter sp. GZD-96]
MFINQKYHLSYCTNIHPGEDWAETFDNIEKFVPEIASKVADGQAFGIGLRLSNVASEELGLGNTLKEFKSWLDRNNLYVYTMNGFPYGNFHREKVKDFVHHPDWTTDERVAYTIRLFKQLAFLLPKNQYGSISTNPISYKYWHGSQEQDLEQVYKVSALNYAKVIASLCEIEKETGKLLQLSIEPEPDGLMENSTEVVSYFKQYLVPIGADYLVSELGVDADEAERLVYKHINVCYDVCHFSLAYEDPEYSFKTFKDAGIAIGKIQISAALKIIFNKDEVEETWNTLSLFNESTYLHQVTEKVGDKVITYTDLPVILDRSKEFKEIRAHFHVPIFLERFGTLLSTQDQILKVLNYLKNYEVTQHLEVETYTWGVLPTALKTNLSDSISRELLWMKGKLTETNA